MDEWLHPTEKCFCCHISIKFNISCETGNTWMPQDLNDDFYVLLHLVAWCHKATSHYLNQCWLRSMMPYGKTSSQWISKTLSIYYCIFLYDQSLISIFIKPISKLVITFHVLASQVLGTIMHCASDCDVITRSQTEWDTKLTWNWWVQSSFNHHLLTHYVM